MTEGLTRERLRAVAEKYTTPGYTITLWDQPIDDGDGLILGSADTYRRTIGVIRPDNLCGLHAYLHENVHAALSHRPTPANVYRIEYEAEAIALMILKREGIPVPIDWLRSRQDYVRSRWNEISCFFAEEPEPDPSIVAWGSANEIVDVPELWQRYEQALEAARLTQRQVAIEETEAYAA